MQDPATEIRPYEPRDRAAVRAICLSTAYGGGGEGLVEPGLFLDLMVRAYTDFAAGSVWVAERAGMEGTSVVGYLAGAFDERRFHRVQAWRVVPAAVARSLGRGLLWRGALWRLLADLPGFLAAGRLAASPEEEGYPGHLHVNLTPSSRGRAVGARLVESFLAEARRRRLSGVRAVVYETNHPARRFFERLGFEPLGRQPAFKPPPDEGDREWKIVYGKGLS
ncbi:MAG TPA: GNAT family N-acetyltransferase [Thermoanaerobaculia bacterium]|jgi:GNAT superfamily N-acetyltransferase|nr:GNAT family N-acetyltransferase [Thermoanaerobaculia bacterium]